MVGSGYPKWQLSKSWDVVAIGQALGSDPLAHALERVLFGAVSNDEKARALPPCQPKKATQGYGNRRAIAASFCSGHVRLREWGQEIP